MKYDATKDIMAFTCPVCELEHDYDTSVVGLVKFHPQERAMWALSIGACPGCGSTHHLNCNLPDDHPHGQDVNALLRRKHGKDLPVATLRTPPSPSI